jgi:acyl-CoA reductase-like NAD-dependent aldehyde dehydrogenase
VYVVDEVAGRFIDGVVRKAQSLTVGDPTAWNTEIGPMVSREQYDLVNELVDDAIAAGATRLCGGAVEVPGFEGHFIAPTVLTDVTHDMRIMREEIFGPVLPIVRVQSEEAAVALANDSQFGLGASVWTLDREKGERIAGQIQAGMVWINDHSYTHAACQCAWGGVKDSGLGRSHSKFGFYECVNIKTVSWEPSRMADTWWQPYDEVLGTAIRASMRLLYGRDGRRREALKEGGMPLLRVTARALRAARR